MELIVVNLEQQTIICQLKKEDGFRLNEIIENVYTVTWFGWWN